MARELSLCGTFVLKSICSQERTLPVTFVVVVVTLVTLIYDINLDCIIIIVVVVIKKQRL